MSGNTLVGIDIGTTSVKAVMIDLDGHRIAEFSQRYATQYPGPGQVEQDPRDWFRLVTAALASFEAVPGRGTVAAIGFTSQVNTHVFVDRGLEVLHPAIVWQDGRAADAGAAIDAQIAPADKIHWLGAPIPIDASHALARMAWMAGARPGIWNKTAHVMAPKDYVMAKLTGAVTADPIASIGLVGADLSYAESLLRLVDGARDRLPMLVDPMHRVGVVAAGLPFAGVPVISGTMDAWVSMLGLGVVRDGEAMYLSGTSEVLGIVSAVRHPEPGVVTFPAWSGVTLHAGPTQAGGASLDWLSRLLGQKGAALAVGAAAITATTPLFLPHLQGERAPLWDMQARGTLAGLTSGTGPADIAASVLEGVAFSARLAFEALKRSAGCAPAVLRCGGGGAASDRWCQIRADAFDLPLQRVTGSDPGALGAAVLAGAASGLVADLSVAAQTLVALDRLFVPDRPAAALAARRFAIWKELYQQMRPINAAFWALSQ